MSVQATSKNSADPEAPPDKFHVAFYGQQPSNRVPEAAFTALRHVYTHRKEHPSASSELLQDEARILHSLYSEASKYNLEAFCYDLPHIQTLLVHAPDERSLKKNYGDRDSWLRFDETGQLVVNASLATTSGNWISINNRFDLMRHLQNDLVVDNTSLEAFCEVMGHAYNTSEEDGFDSFFATFTADWDERSVALRKRIEEYNDENLEDLSRAVLSHHRFKRLFDLTISRLEQERENWSRCIEEEAHGLQLAIALKSAHTIKEQKQNLAAAGNRLQATSDAIDHLQKLRTTDTPPTTSTKKKKVTFNTTVTLARMKKTEDSSYSGLTKINPMSDCEHEESYDDDDVVSVQLSSSKQCTRTIRKKTKMTTISLKLSSPTN